ncbi:hypothetical protein M422DRAFT_271814 [Sphaerobolus stellatus SS14]|uniref:Unplaced genomic scaffold SPHSTscaffold_273, whole genome shotgun sequence n=1 Tax=Sphaerobolus stellatus (strain SS14) TaxID=990650 RepID=A0A0C9TYZ5_SPHS4|nr:hypothetical protein M422DRAFT_271814 [Sphaerobolus stellatus SS14]
MRKDMLLNPLSSNKCTCSQDKNKPNQRPLSEGDHRDQTLFYRGFRIADRTSLKIWRRWSKRKQGDDGFHYYKSKKRSLEHNIDDDMDVDDSGGNNDGFDPHDDTPREGASGPGGSRLGGNYSTNSSTSTFMTATSSPGGTTDSVTDSSVHSDSSEERENMARYLTQKSEPSSHEILMHYILESRPEVKLAIVHDDDFLLWQDTELHNVTEFQDYLNSSCPQVFIEDRVGMLAPTHQAYRQTEKASEPFNLLAQATALEESWVFPSLAQRPLKGKSDVQYTQENKIDDDTDGFDEVLTSFGSFKTTRPLYEMFSQPHIQGYSEDAPFGILPGTPQSSGPSAWTSTESSAESSTSIQLHQSYTSSRGHALIFPDHVPSHGTPPKLHNYEEISLMFKDVQGYRCKECQKCLLTADDAQKHIKAKHRKSVKFKCTAMGW